MDKNLVDLHMHSYASDGTNTPMEILQKAKSKNISLISLTDHNSMENSKEMRKLAKQYDISIIDGVELDASYDGVSYHILGYGVDIDNIEFSKFINITKNKLKANNALLIERMCNDFTSLSYDEFLEYSYDRKKGGWESINYLFEKGITSSLYAGIGYHSKYNCDINSIDFPSCANTINQIHKAGGYAVLAHPGIYFKSNDELNNLLEALLKDKMDGIECYHYKHDELTTENCLDFCRKNNMIITGGCDYHGKFLNNSDIGKIKITMDMLSLGLLGGKIIR